MDIENAISSVEPPAGCPEPCRICLLYEKISCVIIDAVFQALNGVVYLLLKTWSLGSGQRPVAMPSERLIE